MKQKRPSKLLLEIKKRAVVVSVVCGFFIVLIPALSYATDLWYKEKILPGVAVGSMDLGGKSREYARDVLSAYQEKLRTQGAAFHFQDKKVTILPDVIPLGSDIPLQETAPLFRVDVEKTIDRVFAFGREGSAIKRHKNRLRALFQKQTVNPVVTVDKENLTKNLESSFSFFNAPAKNAFFTYKKNAVEIIEESAGIEFDYGKAVDSFEAELVTVRLEPVTLEQRTVRPHTTKNDLSGYADKARSLLQTTPFIIALSDNPQEPKTWVITPSTLAPWITLAESADSSLYLALDEKLIADYLSNVVAPDVFIEVQVPRFEIKDGRVSIFQVPEKGRRLDVQTSAKKIAQAFLEQTKQPTVLAVEEIEPAYHDIPENISAIKELLSSQTTNFVGSPTNRKKNVARGAQLINGILIAPGEEFSTIKALGDITETNGFLPELVIKGDKTTPEFGGGLCQVSTTLFRSVSYAGLPILERRNHSYRVPYYEPPVGFDATIYDPAPDFKFKNDTPNYILIQSRIEGTKITVDLWGARDGRRVEIDKPTVFNIKKAGETKFIETDDLEPGEKKCTERAHNGADAVFERRIFMPDGTVKKETYKSHYVVWPAVCLIGKTPIPPPSTPEQTPSSQDEIISPPLDTTQPIEDTKKASE